MMLERIGDHFLLAIGLDNPKLDDPAKILATLRSKFPNVAIQLLRADRVAGPEHLLFAARNALVAFESGSRRAKSLAVEVLVYISCQRQIAEAIRLIGVTNETR